MRRIRGVGTATPFLVALAMWVASCTAGPDAPPHAPRNVAVIDTWQVLCDSQVLGSLVMMRIDDQVASEPFFQVRNASGQWLGYIDAAGRVYERVPFSMTEVFRGVHPMDEALALLLDERRPLCIAHMQDDSSGAEAHSSGRGEPVPASAFRLPLHRTP